MIDLTEKVEEEKKVLLDLTEKVRPGAAPLDKETLETRAVKYNLALGDTSPGLDKIQMMLQSPGGEGTIRDAAAMQEETERKTAGLDVFREGTDIDAETLQSVAEVSRRPVDRQIALERRFSERVFSSSLAMTSNPEEVGAGVQEEVSQEMYDFLVDQNTKRESFAKILEDRRAVNQNASWGTTLWEIGESIIPFYSASAQVSDSLGEKLKAFLPGNNKEEQYAYIERLSTAEAVELVRRIDAEIGNDNSLEAEQWLSDLVEGYTAGPKALENLLFGLDVAGVTGPVLKKLGVKAVGGVSKSLAGSKRIRDAEAATKSYTVRKEVLNSIPASDLKPSDLRSKSMPGAAQDLKAGDLREKFASGPVIERIRRTAAAVAQPGAKIDEVLAASGHIEEAADLRALELARMMAPDAARSVKSEISDWVKKTPSLMNPKAFLIDTSHAHIARATELAESLMRNRELFATAFSKVLNVQRLPESVERTALDVASKDVETMAKQSGLGKALLTTIEKFETASSGLNIAYVEAKFGKKNGTLFDSKLIADNTAKERYGFLPGSYKVLQEGDGYAIFLRKDIDEVEAIRSAEIKLDPEMVSNTDRNSILGVVPVPRFISGSKEQFSAKQIGERETLTHAQTALTAYHNAMMQPLQVLSKTERKALAKIMDVNRNMRNAEDPKLRGEFFKNASELEMSYIQHIGRLPTAEEVRAYAVFVQQSDMDYIFRSVNTLKAKTRLGVEKMESVLKGNKKISFEGVEKDSLPFSTRYDGSVYDTIGSGKYHRLNEGGLAETLGKRIKDNNLKIVQVYDPEDSVLRKALGVSGPVNFLVLPNVKKGSLRFEEQLPYRPGFHVRYKDEYFVKQGKITRDSTGRKIYSGDTAILGVSNYAKALKEAKLLDRARIAVKTKDENALDQIIREGLPLSKKEIASLFKTRLNIDTPISVTKQGESTAMRDVKTANGRSLADEVGEYEDFSNSPYNMANQVRNQYTGEKNEALWSIAEEGSEGNTIYKMEDARMVDPIQTQMEAMNRLIHDRHYNDYQITAAEGFVKEFADIMTPDGINPWSANEIMRNPIWYLQNAKLKGSPADARYATARQQQLAISNLVRHKSLINSSLAHLKGKALSSIYNRWGEKYVHAFDDFAGMVSADVPTKMRAIAFHTKLGLFNIGQIYLQGQTLAVVTAISPRYGLQATEVTAFMRRLDLMPGDEAVINRMASVASKLTPGWTADHFKESWRLLRSTGFDIVGREQSYRNDIGDVKIFQGNASRFLDSGAMFFNGIERYVRMAAWNAAYREYVDKFPKLAGKLSQSDTKTILSRANDLSMNMTRSSHAIWQEGAASTMTQFWGYSMRMFDALTGKRLTAGEKARLIGVNSMLYGVPIGVTPLLPIWPWEDELRQMLMESGVNTNEGVADMIMNGLVASAISGITSAYGEDIQLDLGGRLGPNAIQVLWNLNETRRDETGLDSLMEILGGASGTIIGKMLTDAIPLAKDLAYVTRADDSVGDDVLIADALNLGKNISSLNVMERAWTAFNLGVYKTKDGRVLDPDYNVYEAVFHGMTGVESQDINDTFLRFRSTQETQAFEQKVSKEAKRWIRLMMEARKRGDHEAADEYRAKARTTMDKSGMTQEQRTRLFENVRKEKPLEEQGVEQYIKAPNDILEQRLRSQQMKEQ